MSADENLEVIRRAYPRWAQFTAESEIADIWLPAIRNLNPFWLRAAVFLTKREYASDAPKLPWILRYYEQCRREAQERRRSGSDEAARVKEAADLKAHAEESQATLIYLARQPDEKLRLYRDVVRETYSLNSKCNESDNPMEWTELMRRFVKFWLQDSSLIPERARSKVMPQEVAV